MDDLVEWLEGDGVKAAIIARLFDVTVAETWKALLFLEKRGLVVGVARKRDGRSAKRGPRGYALGKDAAVYWRATDPKRANYAAWDLKVMLVG